jgi:hypothetical protein
MVREDEIRLIAHNLWEEDCPNGRDCEHWYRAELIWGEKRKPKVITSSSKTEPKKVTKPTTKVMAAKKS